MYMTDQELRAVVGVQRLQARYAHAVDERDGEAVARLFTPDGVFDGDLGPLSGRDELKRFFDQRPLTDPPMRHHIGTIDVRFDADGMLRSTSYLSTTGPVRVTAVYDDEYEEAAEEGWLFKRKTIRVESREKA
jgi:uncharacterized protein (TIGR02246 family)